jgi:hypothetical protein
MDFSQNIERLSIPHDVITIIASGDSADKLTEQQFEYLKEKTFVITMNYAPVKFIGHANIWSDTKVTEFLRDIYSRKEKDHVFISRREAFRPGDEWKDFHAKVDYWFSTEKLKCHYTLSWLFQLLQLYFPKKYVAVFGLDLKPIDDMNDIKKFYDRYTLHDANRRGKGFPLQKKLDAFQSELIRLIEQEDSFRRWTNNVMNINPDSNCILFKKISWDALVGKHWAKP